MTIPAQDPFQPRFDAITPEIIFLGTGMALLVKRAAGEEN